jgi:hypothetical protein
MRKAFAVLAGLVMLVVVVQFFLAASGAFNTAPTDEAFRPHRILGYMSVVLAVLLTVLAAIVRISGRVIGLSGLVAGLMVLQAVIAIIAKAFGDADTSTTAGQIVFGLHGLNALVIFSLLRTILLEARAPQAVLSGAGSGR